MKNGLYHPSQVLHCSYHDKIPPKLIGFLVAAMILLRVSSICAAPESSPGANEFDLYPKVRAGQPDKEKMAPAHRVDQYGLTVLFQRAEDDSNGIGLEVRYRHFVNSVMSLNLATGKVIGFSKLGVDIDFYPVEGSLVLHRDLDGKTQAYFGAGVGYYFVEYDASELDRRYTYINFPADSPLLPYGNSHRIKIDDDIGFTFFSGIEQQLEGNASFFCEIRYLVLEFNAYADDVRIIRGLRLKSAPVEDLDMGGIGLNIGMMWKF
jgi:opacity protein-like surface antigen